MRKILSALLALAVVGCSSEEAPKADAGAPATTYKMVPATTGGGAAGTTPPASPPAAVSAAPSNPASAGSD